MAQAGAVACLNGGFFNHSNGAPVSHVMRGGVVIDDPRANQALMQNAVLRPHMQAILDARSAWLSTPSGWLIAPWRDRPPATSEALQAGPALLPTPALEVEAFRFLTPGGVRDGIQSRTRAPRSALGLCPDGAMAWVAVGAPGLTIAGLGALMNTLGCRHALALDGGSSTGLAWRAPSGEVRSGPHGQAGAAVRSALVVLPPRNLPR
jgi:exopolysaccharide biosynthesis protein